MQVKHIGSYEVLKDEEIGCGCQSIVYNTTTDDIVYIETADYFKYEFIKLYGEIHQIDFKLSEEIDISKDRNTSKSYLSRASRAFFMQKLQTRRLKTCEIEEIEFFNKIIDNVDGFIFDVQSELKNTTFDSNIGKAFSKSIDVVCEFLKKSGRTDLVLDFHRDQILFTDEGEAIVLDILI